MRDYVAGCDSARNHEEVDQLSVIGSAVGCDLWADNFGPSGWARCGLTAYVPDPKQCDAKGWTVAFAFWPSEETGRQPFSYFVGLDDRS